MERFLQQWREDASSKGQLDSAVFIADKLFALTNSNDDALQLAQLHFSSGNYTRVLALLERKELVATSSESRYLAAHCYIKQNRIDDALAVLGDVNPTHLFTSLAKGNKAARVSSDAVRHGSSSSQHINKPTENGQESRDRHHRRFEAAICYLRGVCYARQNAFDRAKNCYMDAVRIDVQCFEAFDQLMKNSLLSPDEEWEFLDQLDFDSITVDGHASSSQQAAELTRMLYITRLSKYKNSKEFFSAIETLSTHYGLASNSDLLLAQAELFFTQCRFKDALLLTERVLEYDRYNFAAIPIYLAILFELNERNRLFLLAHDLADHHAEEPATWLAVGAYYLAIGKISDARRFFSKASMMDPHFGPAWIGFAHTFAAEGEHDQAISAYSTAARLFQGTHLPQLFLGMQNLHLQNMSLAHEYLNSAFRVCREDSLLLNELGVVLFYEDRIEDCIAAFTAALNLAHEVGSESRSWATTRNNLGHAYRRAYKWREALQEFEEVLRQGGRDANVLCAIGLVKLEMGDEVSAILTLHQALAVNPLDSVANDLLSRALEDRVSLHSNGLDAEDTTLNEVWHRGDES